MIVLAEDQEQQQLVRHYLDRCGLKHFRVLPPAAKGPGGSGEKYVRDQYPVQVKACRSALGRQASALLIVIIDADTQSTRDRLRQLEQTLSAAGQEPRERDEPIVLLIPKRHVETWIRALLGETVTEAGDYTRPGPLPAEIKRAALRVHEWISTGGDPVPAFPPSLNESSPEWRKIPK